MIIQGTNKPIIFTFSEDMSDILDIEISLSADDEELKHWTVGEVTIDGNKIIAPLTQAETVTFPVGKCLIEVKWMDSFGHTQFAKGITNQIAKRYDKTIMEGAE